MSYKYCPHCGGQLPPPLQPKEAYAGGEIQTRSSGPIVYDQTLYWRDLIKDVSQLQGAREARIVIPENFTNGDLVVHILFRDSVSPRGGIMNSMVQGATVTNQPQRKLTREDLSALGYVTDEEGKIVLVNDTPVGRAYQTVKDWGDRSMASAGMAKPVSVSPSRTGDPNFIDGEIMAFTASFSEPSMVLPSLILLDGMLRKETCVPLLINAAWVR